MTRVRTEDLRPGMIPAAEVSSHNGRGLIAPGQPLAEDQIQMLKAWGVQKIEIEESESCCGNTFPETGEVPEPAREALDELFRYTDREHPAIRELYAYCRLRKSGGEMAGVTE